MEKKLALQSVDCLGYHSMIKEEYMEITEPSALENIIEEIIELYPNILYGGSSLTKDNIKALYHSFYGAYLFENELVISISHYNKYITLGHCKTFSDYEEVLYAIEDYKENLNEQEEG